ncbi:MAG: prepilin-type N-terminal cleavage/methylation domain-containing protein [Oscillospiraceae bacterium]|nr:prepilin-type N-terminal cleavage/methylation domain-containing protein [Oscillospiraceae bacterium]
MKKLKGFTLVELIIVMFILTILMTAILQMFKPIRETYLDSTFYENQRTTQNGIITYINESIRYAVDMGIYEDTSMTNAINSFKTAYIAKYGTAPVNQSLIDDNVQVIVIDNSGSHTFNHNTSLQGRVLRKKSDGTTRVAMGEAYYGENNYDIVLSDGKGATGSGSDPWKAENGIKITVSTWLKRSNEVVSVQGEVLCRNLMSSDHGVSNPGMFVSPTSASTPTHGTGKNNVYIVYLNGEDKSNIP